VWRLAAILQCPSGASHRAVAVRFAMLPRVEEQSLQLHRKTGRKCLRGSRAVADNARAGLENNPVNLK